MLPAHDTKQRSSSFHLEKWYLDLVTEKGEAFIFYTARLKWGRITIPFKSMLHIPVSGDPLQRYRFRDARFPQIDGRKLNWEDSHLKTAGTWESRSEPLQEQLLQTTSGELEWNCVQPLSRVNLLINGLKTEGWGYAEQLVLSVEPWKLPVRVLQWGRFCSEGQQLTWIEIQHDTTRQWVWYNGERMGNATLTPESVQIHEKNIRLECSNSRPAGKRNLLQRVMEKLCRFIPGFRHSVPRSFILSEEKKWVSEGKLLQHGVLISSGWVIHEQVFFNSNGRT